MHHPSTGTKHYRWKYWSSRYHKKIYLDNMTILVSFFTHFDFESVSSYTKSWLTILTYIIYLVAEAIIYSYLFLSYLKSNSFSLLDDKHFETNEKVSFRIDEWIILFYNTFHWLVWWVNKWWIHFSFSTLQSFFYRNLYLISLFFVNYGVNQVRNFC